MSRKIDAALFEQKWVDDLVARGQSHYVLLYIFLIVTCRNPAGIFEVVPRLWNYKLNPSKPFTGEDVFTVFGKRIRRIDGHPDKGIIIGFCDFQSNFSKQSRQWQWVVKDLEAVGLTYEDLKRWEDEQNEVQPELNLDLPPKPVKHREAKETPQRCVIPPQVEWVRDYCSTRNNGIDAQAFVDFYTSKGWKVGGEAMKDWQAAVRTWEKRRDIAPTQTVTQPAANVGEVRRKF